MNIPTQAAVQQELVTALVEMTGYVPELFSPHVRLIDELGLTLDEVQGAVTSVEQKLRLPSRPSVDGATVSAIAEGLVKSQSPGVPVQMQVEMSLEQVLAFVDDRAARNDRPVLETILQETRGALARLDALGVVPVVAPVVGASSVAAPVATDVMKLLVGALVERTGYPAEMLEADLDLEADLGIDTVKQVEAFAMARVHLNVEKDENFRLRDHNTLNKMVKYLTGKAPATAPAPAPVVEVVQAREVAPASGAASTVEGVVEFLRAAMAAKTGYGLDILQPKLDLEVDLGIDTVTQVEVFAHARTTHGVARDDKFRVRHYNTLQKMAEYLVARAPAPVATSVPSVPAAKEGTGTDEVMKLLVGALVERTGYPAEMLEADLDLEADLGIDTVKQVEAFAMARVHLNVEKDENFRLRDHNTLNKMVKYLTGRAPAAALSVPATPAPVALVAARPMTPEVTEVSSGFSAQEVQAYLVTVLQGKTGYNIELIQPNLDLEVDLGIDTVTQLEAFAMAREKFGVARNEKFRVRNYNTLQKMSEYLVAHAQASKGPEQVPEQGSPGIEDVRRFIARCEASGDTASLRKLAEHLEGQLRAPVQAATPPSQFSGKRYEVHPVALEVQADVRTVAHLKGKTLGITTDSQGSYKTLAKLLEAAGARVVILSSEAGSQEGVSLDWSQPESVGQRLKQVQETQPLDGLILLHTASLAPKLMDQEVEAWSSTLNTFSLGLFQSGVAVYDRIHEIPGGGWFVVATAGGGFFGHTNAQGRIPLAGAAGGFVKCLRRERLNARCKVVDLDIQDSALWARQIWNELVCTDRDVEVGYSGGRRYVFRDIETSLTTAPVNIKPGSVVVVSGGGRGVVYPCAKLLAKVTGARVIITGRTVPPRGDEEWLKVPEADLPAYRMSFIKRHLAEHPGTTPVQARRVFDSDVANRRELHRNLEDCRKQGISLEYKVCDMTDVSAVRSLLAQVRRDYGRIDGIVHGATIEESKSLPMKSSDAFVRTLASKAHLWRVLVQETWNDKLQFFINFGSGSGRYGNKGQTDYSLANYLVAKAGLVYGELRPGVRSVTIDWPVWVGAGIVENNADYLERLRAMGICVIHIEEGAYWFVEELLRGGSAGEVVIADDRTFETLNLPRYEQAAPRVVGQDAGGTRYAI
ncbi:SDR family NAD(P)-dependent oxidoreductase [Myxococcus landrumensis]|uniref:SDR family NAD(P)-dependent oxidoreductase n=1 Tax=Myxococcus landrumensis TaxID=2813577 RepID=A0ABX7N8E2_9BACT|nr:SDR family NAD(P)-dependent oxidoreductase [Myxococcus landrumus]QSQ15032.1 SDR family NAD(P)-dependent oxidoreductase [Myxococcus landrumus]